MGSFYILHQSVTCQLTGDIHEHGLDQTYFQTPTTTESKFLNTEEAGQVNNEEGQPAARGPGRGEKMGSGVVKGRH